MCINLLENQSRDVKSVETVTGLIHIYCNGFKQYRHARCFFFFLEIYIMLSSSYSQSMSLSFLILKVTETKIEKKKKDVTFTAHPFRSRIAYARRIKRR